MRSFPTFAMACSNAIESTPPDTASSSGESVRRTAMRAASSTARSEWMDIANKYTSRPTAAGICRPLAGDFERRYLFRRCTQTHASPTSRSDTLETHGPLGTLWVGLGLCAFYIALVWINTLLGFFLTP